jgi:putative hydrolase of the HAD superfamily
VFRLCRRFSDGNQGTGVEEGESMERKTEKIKAVLFDFGGVLAEEGFRHGLLELARRQRLDSEVVSGSGRRIVHESGYVTGRGSEKEFWRRMREETGLQGSDRELSDTILSCFVIRPRMMGCVRQLRSRGFITAIVSDQTDWLERLDRRYGFFREFDHIFNSYRRGKTKWDPSTFDDVARELGIAPSMAVFIDDTPGHVERARDRGMHGIIFEDEDRFVRQMEELLGMTCPRH